MKPDNIQAFTMLKMIEPEVAEAFSSVWNSKNGNGTVVIRIKKKQIIGVKYDVTLKSA